PLVSHCPACGTPGDGPAVCSRCGHSLLDVRPGLVLGGRYRLGDLLGEGAAGRVHRGVDVVERKEVAIKLLLGSWGRSAEMAARFRREAVALVLLRHPSIVTLYDVDEVAGMPYLVLELLRGRRLDELVVGRPPPPVAL